MNADNSVDVYFGPKPPPGKESNWVQTMPRKGWFVILRLYGPTPSVVREDVAARRDRGDEMITRVAPLEQVYSVSNVQEGRTNPNAENTIGPLPTINPTLDPKVDRHVAG